MQPSRTLGELIEPSAAVALAAARTTIPARPASTGGNVGMPSP
jgi:hypothetical protein